MQQFPSHENKFKYLSAELQKVLDGKKKHV
jgi:hypothetical protein